MDYWSEEYGHGSFDYPVRWNGFNLPSKAINKWMDKFCHIERNGVRDREWEILDAIDTLRGEEEGEEEGEDEEEEMPDKYYVIGTHEESIKEDRDEVIAHESVHAMYYLNLAYKRATNQLLESMGKRAYNKAEKMLLKMGYGKNVVKDEMQAYFSTNEIEENSKLVDLQKRAIFVKNFNKYGQK